MADITPAKAGDTLNVKAIKRKLSHFPEHAITHLIGDGKVQPKTDDKAVRRAVDLHRLRRGPAEQHDGTQPRGEAHCEEAAPHGVAQRRLRQRRGAVAC